MSDDSLPYLLTDFPGVGGLIKERPEDFFVQEIPLYDPSGEGEHVYAEIQKVGLTTLDAIGIIARKLGISPRVIGYAGMKDAQAVTRQTISIQGHDLSLEAVMAIKEPNLEVLWASRHGNKLRLGHLAGNRFAVKLREVDPMKVVTLRPALDTLAKRGIPNYFGEQRFGRRGNNDLIGAAFLRGDDKEALRLILGDPKSSDGGDIHAARKNFEKGDLERSMHHWPRRSGMERRMLAKFIRTGDATKAIFMADLSVRKIWVSALQSRIFNTVLTQRLTTLDQVQVGDLAYKHDSGACFFVENLEAEAPRAERFEISPTGPIIGRRTSMARGVPGEIEQAVLAKYGITAADFKNGDRDRSPGDRRPLRIMPRDTQLESGVDQFGGFITVAFTLPPGAYATVLMRELTKLPEEPAAIAEEPAGAEEGETETE